MAKKSKILRNQQRVATVAKYAKRRAELKAASVNMRLTEEERQEAMSGLASLPRNASPVRVRNRCYMTGRSRGYYRKFGLGRNKLREMMMRGEVPGVVKASW
ncbi:MAG: 30S ribosomal protein S14 [Gammaproteobacteria bacterium]|nr:30S ribosomal protein S14 [Gammaproteobacteria bacterium]